MTPNRQFVLFYLHTSITVISGYVAVSQQNPLVQNMNLAHLSVGLRAMALKLINIQTYVQNAGSGFDHLLYIIEYSFKFSIIALVAYFLQGYFIR